MQKRHFELIAATLKARRAKIADGDYPVMVGVVDALAADFADAFAAANVLFDRARFLKACGQ